jgi:hypothetical protein
MQDLSLPPLVKVGVTIVDVTVLTDDGATVVVNLPRRKGLHDMPESEIAGRARQLARKAMISAVESLDG